MMKLCFQNAVKFSVIKHQQSSASRYLQIVHKHNKDHYWSLELLEMQIWSVNNMSKYLMNREIGLQTSFKF